jgi:hypothetical protein
MPCPLGRDESAEFVVGYVARTLDGRAHAGFERHMKSCQVCVQAVAAQQAVWDALNDWRAVAVSHDFDRSLRSRIAHQHQAGWQRRLWRPAVACALLGAAFWLHHPRAAEVVAPSASQASPQIEKLEHALASIRRLTSSSACRRSSSRRP